MKIFSAKMKIYKRTDKMEFKRTPWLNLFPFVALFGAGADNGLTKLSAVNIGWLFWELWFYTTTEE